MRIPPLPRPSAALGPTPPPAPPASPPSRDFSVGATDAARGPIGITTPSSFAPPPSALHAVQHSLTKLIPGAVPPGFTRAVAAALQADPYLQTLLPSHAVATGVTGKDRRPPGLSAVEGEMR